MKILYLTIIELQLLNLQRKCITNLYNINKNYFGTVCRRILIIILPCYFEYYKYKEI